MTALRNVLEHVGDTPIVPLRTFDQPGAPVVVKCEHLNPWGSVKDRIARSMIVRARERGELRPGQPIVEATAGNTGIALAMVGAALGHPVICVMPEKMSADKRRALRSLGASVVITDNAPPSDPRNFQRVAERMAAEEDVYWPNQFANPANIEAHEQGTGPEILRQLGGQVSAFVAGAGTGGTLTGVARAFRAAGCDADIVLADPEGSSLAQWVHTGALGPDGAYAVEGIGSSEPPANLHRDLLGGAETVSDAESFSVTRALIRSEGLLVGGSAGTAVAAALRVAARLAADAPPVVALLPDHMDRYLGQDWLGAAPE